MGLRTLAAVAHRLEALRPAALVDLVVRRVAVVVLLRLVVRRVEAVALPRLGVLVVRLVVRRVAVVARRHLGVLVVRPVGVVRQLLEGLVARRVVHLVVLLLLVVRPRLGGRLVHPGRQVSPA